LAAALVLLYAAPGAKFSVVGQGDIGPLFRFGQFSVANKVAAPTKAASSS